MAKVYMKVKRINEDVSITDSTLAQQYLAVKKQMADKQTRRDNLMKQVNQLDSEMNILQKNLIAIEAKSAAASVKSEEKEKVQQPDQKAAETKPATTTETQPQEGTNESFTPNPAFDEFMEEVIASIDETYHDGEGLVYQYKPLIKKYFKKGETAEDVASMIIEMETNWKDTGVEFNKIRQAWGGDDENESYIGGDNMGKFNANMGTPTRVAESIYDDLTSSIQTELEDLEKELQKLTDIKDYIENYDNQGVKEDPEDVDIDININVDGEEEVPEELPTEVEELPAIPQDTIALPSPDEEDGMFMGVPETIEDYDEDKDYSNISDEIVDTEDRPDPFTPGEEEKIVDETLKAEDKAPYVPQLVEQEDIETELELMNYEDEDEPQDEYVFYIRLEPDTDEEVVAKIYKEDEDDEWTTRVVKGDEAIQDIQFDNRLNKLDIIGYLANLFGEVEEIDKKEYEYLLDDKEKIDKEYYEKLEN